MLGKNELSLGASSINQGQMSKRWQWRLVPIIVTVPNANRHDKQEGMYGEDEMCEAKRPTVCPLICIKRYPDK